MTQDILVVDDDPRLREVVRYALARAGYTVREAADGRLALEAIARQAPDLVVLDVMMPELDGLDVVRRLRATGDGPPVVFLSSRAEEVDKVVGLELGGDDYITKPFSTRELVSRVKAVLRRARPPGTPGAGAEPASEGVEPVLEVGPVRLDPVEHRVWVRGEEVEFTVTEFNLLKVLMSRPGRAFSRDELVDRAYPGRHFVSGRTVDSHMRHVRQKLRGAGEDPVETVHGVGYRLRKPDPA